MELIRGLHNLAVWHRKNPASPCVLTIGNYDGVHRGHQAVIGQVKRKADELGLPARIIIFEPQPLEFFAPDKAPARLTSFRGKVKVLCRQPIDSVVCLYFNAELAGMSAVDFVEQVLVRQLQVKHMIIGDDFRFGAKQQGDFELLQRCGEKFGFGVDRTETLICENQRASSTRIREALAVGDFDLAQEVLARPYSIGGRVIHGQEIGRKLGTPTANISLKGKIPPLSGVYAVEVGVRSRSGERLKGVANVGVRPTVDGDKKPLLEVHLFDFNENIYAERIRVYFQHKIRDEVRFDGLDALKQQIQKDIELAKTYFANK